MAVRSSTSSTTTTSPTCSNRSSPTSSTCASDSPAASRRPRRPPPDPFTAFDGPMTSHTHGHDHHRDDHDDHGHGHGHSHGLIDRSITRSRDGLRTVAISLAVLLVTAAVQTVIFVATGSVALLADLIHNFGDALTAIPLGIAFFLRSFVAEKRAGYFVVLTIFISACVAAVEAVNRLVHPQTLDHLGVLAAAGAVGFIGNEIAAQVRLRGGRRLNSPALIADGNHARVDGFVSLAVVASAAVVA